MHDPALKHEVIDRNNHPGDSYHRKGLDFNKNKYIIAPFEKIKKIKIKK
jgi:hypothetical protein